MAGAGKGGQPLLEEIDLRPEDELAVREHRIDARCGSRFRAAHAGAAGRRSAIRRWSARRRAPWRRVTGSLRSATPLCGWPDERAIPRSMQGSYQRPRARRARPGRRRAACVAGRDAVEKGVDLGGKIVLRRERRPSRSTGPPWWPVQGPAPPRSATEKPARLGDTQRPFASGGERGLAARVATTPLAKVSRASATSFVAVAIEAPDAATETTGAPASVSARSMSWIIRSRTTSTSVARPVHGVRRTQTIRRGAVTRSAERAQRPARTVRCGRPEGWFRFARARATRSAAAATSAAIGFSTKTCDAGVDEVASDRVMERGRNRDRRGVDLADQVAVVGEGGRAILCRGSAGAGFVRIDHRHQARLRIGRVVARMVRPERADPDHPDVDQFALPRPCHHDSRDRRRHERQFVRAHRAGASRAGAGTRHGRSAASTAVPIRRIGQELKRHTRSGRIKN